MNSPFAEFLSLYATTTTAAAALQPDKHDDNNLSFKPVLSFFSSAVYGNTNKNGSALLATVRVDMNEYKVAAGTVTIVDNKTSKYLEAYKEWT